MNRIEFKKSPMKTVGLLIMGLALVAASILVTRTGEDQFIRVVGWIGAVFFGLAVVKSLRDLFSTDVAYVFDEQGIDDRLTGMGFIPWSAITRIEVLSMRGTKFLMLSFDRPEDYLQRVSAAKRALASMNKTVGWGDWSLAFVGLSPGIDEAERFVAGRGLLADA